MLQLIDSKINLENVYNKELCMRMGLISDNYNIVKWLKKNKNNFLQEIQIHL